MGGGATIGWRLKREIDSPACTALCLGREEYDETCLSLCIICLPAYWQKEHWSLWILDQQEAVDFVNLNDISLNKAIGFFDCELNYINAVALHYTITQLKS